MALALSYGLATNQRENMADLSLITEFSGLTITSDQTVGTTNPNATFAVASVTTAQKALLQNVTPYTAEGNTVKVKNGTMIYCIEDKALEVFVEGTWQKVSVDAAVEEISISGIAGTITLTTDQDNPSIILKNAVNTATTTIQGAGTNTAVTYILPATPAQTRGQKLAVSDVIDGVIYLGWLS
jgi:hypothetical protein